MPHVSPARAARFGLTVRPRTPGLLAASSALVSRANEPERSYATVDPRSRVVAALLHSWPDEVRRRVSLRLQGFRPECLAAQCPREVWITPREIYEG